MSSRAAFVFGGPGHFRLDVDGNNGISAEPSTSRGQISVAQVKAMLDQSLTKT